MRIRIIWLCVAVITAAISGCTEDSTSIHDNYHESTVSEAIVVGEWTFSLEIVINKDDPREGWVRIPSPQQQRLVGVNGLTRGFGDRDGNQLPPFGNPEGSLSEESLNENRFAILRYENGFTVPTVYNTVDWLDVRKHEVGEWVKIVPGYSVESHPIFNFDGLTVFIAVYDESGKHIRGFNHRVNLDYVSITRGVNPVQEKSLDSRGNVIDWAGNAHFSGEVVIRENGGDEAVICRDVNISSCDIPEGIVSVTAVNTSTGYKITLAVDKPRTYIGQ